MARILEDCILLWAGFIPDITLYHAFFSASPELYRAQMSLQRVIQENQDS